MKKNTAKIVLGERKRKRKTRRAKRASRQQSQQMELLETLASRPHMRAINQPQQPDPEKEQNQLVKQAMLASNIGVIQALNNLSERSFGGGATFGTTRSPTNPTGDRDMNTEDSSSLDREFLLNNIDSIPLKKKPTRQTLWDYSPHILRGLRTKTERALQRRNVIEDADLESPFKIFDS